MRIRGLTTIATGLGMMAALVATAAPIQTRFDPRDFKGPHHRTPNQLLVLGSAHLSQLPDGFRASALDLLIARLAAWQPQAIAVEAISGVQCDMLRRYPARYRETVEAYCWDPAPALAATGMDVPAATAAIETTLAGWPATPSPAQRRRLAALFLAGGERGSALVQWLRLPVSERRADGALDATLVAMLEKLQVRDDETMLIAAPIAARMGLDRLYSIDDHSADVPIPETDEKAYGVAIEKAWENPANAKRRTIEDPMKKRLDSGKRVLTLYRSMNAPDQGKLIFDSDFGAALEEPSPQQYGRGYVSYWETRNLRMAANIREMFGGRPGIRALVVVGASHKPYLDAYLNEMHDVRIANTAAVLR